MLIKLKFQICDHFSSLKRKGRPKKNYHHSKMLMHKTISNCTPTSCTNPTYIKEYIFDMNAPLPRKDIECPICCDVLHQPVQLDCGALVCSNCCHQWVESSTEPSCPCCYNGHPFNPNSIRQAPDMVISVLNNLVITCNKCNGNLQAGQHGRHLDSGCSECVIPSTSQREERIASGFIRRMLSESPDSSTIKIPPPTSGKVYQCNLCNLSIDDKLFNSHSPLSEFLALQNKLPNHPARP